MLPICNELSQVGAHLRVEELVGQDVPQPPSCAQQAQTLLHEHEIDVPFTIGCCGVVRSTELPLCDVVLFEVNAAHVRRVAQHDVETAMGVEDLLETCLLYTSDAADDLLCVDLGGRR